MENSGKLGLIFFFFLLDSFIEAENGFVIAYRQEQGHEGTVGYDTYVFMMMVSWVDTHVKTTVYFKCV